MINSVVVKLSKLTVATKVFRGVCGKVLPDQFWVPNEFGVKGGIESAFMSTTRDRNVALQYATEGPGFVFEIQQVRKPIRNLFEPHLASQFGCWLTRRAWSTAELTSRG